MRQAEAPPGGHGESRRLGRSEGVYHINTVDEVTPWQGVESVPVISETDMSAAPGYLRAAAAAAWSEAGHLKVDRVQQGDRPL